MKKQKPSKKRKSRQLQLSSKDKRARIQSAVKKAVNHELRKTIRKLNKSEKAASDSDANNPENDKHALDLEKLKCGKQRLESLDIPKLTEAACRHIGISKSQNPWKDLYKNEDDAVKALIGRILISKVVTQESHRLRGMTTSTTQPEKSEQQPLEKESHEEPAKSFDPNAAMAPKDSLTKSKKRSAPKESKDEALGVEQPSDSDLDVIRGDSPRKSKKRSASTEISGPEEPSGFERFNQPASMFLGSLNVGDDDANHGSAKAKNRMGQSARRKLYEKLYGAKANHLQKERTLQKPHSQKVPAKAPELSKRSGTAIGEDHPSWIASKKQKELMNSAVFQGSKITFD